MQRIQEQLAPVQRGEGHFAPSGSNPFAAPAAQTGNAGDGEEEDNEEEQDYLHQWMEDKPEDVKRRVIALEVLHQARNTLHAAFSKEVYELEKKYQALYVPLYDNRSKVVNASTPDDLAKDDGARTHLGLPDFWLVALKNSSLSEEIFEQHEPALKALTDIRTSFIPDEQGVGFTVDFHFKDNEFFSNAVLSKTFVVMARKNVKSMLRSISQQFDTAEDSRRTELLPAIRLLQSNLVAIAADCDTGGISTFLRDFATEGSALCASLEATFTSLKQLGAVPSALDFAKELLLTAGGHKESGKQKKDKVHSEVAAAEPPAPSNVPSQAQVAAPFQSDASNTADAISMQQLAESASQHPAKATLPEALAMLQYQQKTLLRSLKSADTKKSGKLNKVAVLKVLSTFNLQPDVINSVFKLGNPDPAGYILIDQFLKAIDANVAAKPPKKESTVAASSAAEALNMARSAHPLSSNWAIAVSGRRPGPLPPSHLAPASSVDSSLAPSMGAVPAGTASSTVLYGNSGRASGDRTAVANRITDTIDRLASRVPDPRPLSSDVRDSAIRNASVHGAAVALPVHAAAAAVQTKLSGSTAAFANEILNFPRLKAALEELYLTPTYGLSAITLSAQLPSFSRVVFLLIGNGAGRRAVVEQYCGIRIRAPVHSHDPVIRVVVPGDGNVEMSAAQAVAAVPVLEEELAARSIAVDDSIISGCTYPSAERESSGTVFVLAPHIDGRTASDHAPTNQALVAVRSGLKRAFPSLKEAFESCDQRNTGFIGPVGFAELISELNVQSALEESEVASLFECVDLNGDGFIEYEEFLSAFRSVSVVCNAVVEDILDAVSARATSIIAALTPSIMDASGDHFRNLEASPAARLH